VVAQSQKELDVYLLDDGVGDTFVSLDTLIIDRLWVSQS
jgi:hypothetical protein